MLERVSSAECAAHIVLRCFEAPVRTHRVLGPSFWSHGRRQIDVPLWWPAYLESVRNRNDVAPSNSRFVSIKHTKSSITPPISRTSKPTKSPVRTFSNSPLRAQTAAANIVVEHYVEDRNNDGDNSGIAQRDTFRETRAKRDPILEEKPKSSGEKDIQLDEAWNDFAKSRQKDQEASWLLYKFAGGNRKTDLEHALQAFSFIPKRHRTDVEYSTAVDISVRLEQYAVAIQIIREALSRQMNQETFVKFLALCISKSLWTTAGELWRAVGRLRNPAFWKATRVPTSKMRNFAGRYTHCFDVVADLPAKLMALAARLRKDDPVLFDLKHDLVDLCKNLALTAAESDKVISLITGEGVLALLALETGLNFHSGLHVAALASINRMSDKGMKSQVAMLIYNDLRRNRQNAFVPKWALRALIEICSAAREPPHVYRSLLTDYQDMYGLPEREVYLQVLTACANQGESEHVHTVFQDFCVNAGPKNADDINSLIRAHAVIGDCSQAQARFDQVSTTYGLEPSVKNWNTLLLAYSRSSFPDKTYDKFQEMMRSRTRPDKFSWSIMVGVSAQKGDTNLANVWVRRAREAGILPTIAMIGALVDSHLLNDSPSEAEYLVTETTKTSREGVQSCVRLWNSLLRYYAFKADSEAILQIQQAMKEFGVRADRMTYAALMTALVVQGRTSDAAQIIRTLHFSRTVSANEFHYSILIHGFVMERKYEQASVTYHELQERFPRTTPSARLSMLHLQASREEEKTRTSYLSGGTYSKPDFRSVLKSITELTSNTNSSDRASPFPNPGFGRRSSRSDIENIYFDSLIGFLRRNEDHVASQKILELLEKEGGSLAPKAPSIGPSQASRFRRRTHELEIAIDSENWTAASSIWNHVLQDALRDYAPMHPKQSPSTNSSDNPPKNIQLVGSTQFEFSSMVFQPFTSPVSKTNENLILPAHRFALSRPLSLYIRALDRQQKYAALTETIASIQSHGFTLSSRNWNHFIQALCKSPSTDHWASAYEIFERYLLPRAPSWEVMRRGQWVSPSEERPRHYWQRVNNKRDARKSRKFLEKLNPALLMPSYYTVVHLATVWLKVSRLSSQGDHAARRRLESQTPGTVKIARETPYLKDRVQGILLRGRKVIGDSTERPRQYQDQSNFAGIQGSQLLVDHLSPDALADIRELAATEQPITKAHLPKAERITGEIDQSQVVLPSKGRMETLVEKVDRITSAKGRKLRLLRRFVREMREILRHTAPMVGTTIRGQPALNSPSMNSQHSTSSRASSSKYDERVFRPSPDGSMRQHDTGTNLDSERKGLLLRIGRLLRKFSRQSQHKPTAVVARYQGRIIRTSALARRRYLKMTLPTGKRCNAFVAEPIQRSAVRARRSKPTSNTTNASTTSLQPEERRKLPTLSSMRNYKRTLQRLVSAYTKQYRAKQARASDSNFLPKRLAKQIKWYEYNARRASGKLRSIRSHLKQARADNQQP